MRNSGVETCMHTAVRASRSSFASFPRLCLPSALPAPGTTPQDKWVPLVLHCRPQAELGKDFERCSVLHAYGI